MKQEKTKEERLKEGVSILTQLKEAKVSQKGNGYQMLQKHISEWVTTGEAWDGEVDFAEHGRIGIISLPRYNNKAAGMNFKVKRI
jgi:hypothetical protein